MSYEFKLLNYLDAQKLLAQTLADNAASPGVWSDSNKDLLYTYQELAVFLEQITQVVGYSSLAELQNDLNNEESLFNLDTGEFVMWLYTKSQGKLTVYYHKKSLLPWILGVVGVVGVAAAVYVKTR